VALAPVPADPEATPSARDREDLLVVERACAGDAAHVERLVARLLPVVRSVMRNRLRGAADPGSMVEDGTQELFLRLFADRGRVLRRWSPAAGLPLERYVALVADRLAVSLVRAWARGRDHATLEEVANTLTAGDPPPDQWLHSRQALGLLFDALAARLSPLGRRLFELLFVEERSTESICEATGISADSVYAWRSRLRRRALELVALVESHRGPEERR
jgi:RNA polymerase sigma-70 factor (ECF subfamily)